ncbi:MAG: hypothetical protein GTO63_14405 [Anaerolineae bacterium]|nr:hypothetical protein [Anaerolineae bacterium]NIN96039.1 hypothetical protein [Anaerolineae bacterium]NIQ79069.1 hypothetical protein [Anaerolineae bacterium]
MPEGLFKVILDYDGTLTAEEDQVGELAEKSISTLSQEILKVPLAEVRDAYHRTRAMLLAEPHKYWWEVNGGIASYSDEGAFITNTTTIQTMLRLNSSYAHAVEQYFGEVEYDPIVDCSNYLFHKHTFDLEPHFREPTERVLGHLVAHPLLEPIILSSSKGDKVRKNLRILGFEDIRVLGDTRQYEIDPSWKREFVHPGQGSGQIFRVDEKHTVDLRRPAYYSALANEMQNAEGLLVAADTFSMPGALPMMMGIPFLLLKTEYTPAWCEAYVTSHPHGEILPDLALLTLPCRGRGVRARAPVHSGGCPFCSNCC